MILAGKVKVNGRVVRTMGTCVDPQVDMVSIGGNPIQLKRKLYVAVHKPRGHVCTRSDERDRPILGELLPPEWQHLYPVGRLDRDSEGLIFVTNDGAFALRVTHPRHRIGKVYLAEVAGKVTPAVMTKLKRGVEHQGERLQPRAARLLMANNTRSIVELELAEGKNREVRRIFAVLGIEVLALRREQIGPIKLGELRVGKWRMLSESEINSVLNTK